MKFKAIKRNRGFTLLELLITVAIIGILAAIAIPVFSTYVARSKASEVATNLFSIREAEESYNTNYSCYTDPLPWYPIPYPPKCTSDTIQWAFDAASPWYRLNFNPGGPTYYSYKVDTNCLNGIKDPTHLPTGEYTNVGTTWPANIGQWFVVMAAGDVDCNNITTHFYLSSHNKNIFHKEEDDY